MGGVSRPGDSESVSLRPGAFYSSEYRQFLLPYEAVRSAEDPDRMVSEFLHSTYQAAADGAGWDREALEDHPDRWRDEQPRRR